ncbi:MAG: hypothetical protein LBU89_04465 [Fibromonadaceae bacterium]|jgi:hypothetical protein|nr:hypothetical protein [Fibromonadaceae bacterium]
MSYNINYGYIPSSITDEFSKEDIQKRYDYYLAVAKEFIKERNLENVVIMNEDILWHVILDCYADISRLKSFHKLKEVNEVKTIPYEIYWFLERKPLQIIKDNEQSIFINEAFALFQILLFISKNSEDNFTTLTDKKFSYFTDTLFYFLKYRIKSPQSIELMLLAFEAGKEYQKVLK